MTQFRKYYSVKEARATLPRLRKLFARLHQAREVVEDLDYDLAQRLQETGGDLGGPRVVEFAEAICTINTTFQVINGLGIEVKDLDRGLVDFPHRREGRVVFLCWELSEEDVEHWHEIEEGYGGREKL
jgi:hypothetical protein